MMVQARGVEGHADEMILSASSPLQSGTHLQVWLFWSSGQEVHSVVSVSAPLTLCPRVSFDHLLYLRLQGGTPQTGFHSLQ